MPISVADSSPNPGMKVLSMLRAGGVLAAVLVMLSLGSASAQTRPYETLGPGVWFLRITNPADSGHGVSVRAYFNPNRPPWYGDVWCVGRAGKVDGASPPPRNEWLRPGERTGWLDIGPYMSKRPLLAGSPQYLSPVYLGVWSYPERADRLWLDVEIAHGTPENVIRDISVRRNDPLVAGYWVWLSKGPTLPTLGLLIPLETERSARVWTFEEAAEQQLAWVRKSGALPARPRKMLFSSVQRPVAFRNPSGLARINTLIAHELGYNDLVNYAVDRQDVEAMRSLGIEPIRNYRTKIASGATKPEVVNSLRERGLWDYVRLCVLGDEIELHLTMSDEEQNSRFRQYLRERNFDPMDFVRPADRTVAARAEPERRWAYVRLQGPLPAEKPKLLYEAAVFRYRLWAEELAETTGRVQQQYPPGTLTGACLSPHLSLWPDVRKWIDPVKSGAMTMPWSEDWWWQVPEPGPQATGYVLDALRLAASYHDAPIRFECVADPGETPEHFVRMNYLAVAHGVKEISHFTIYNQAWGTSDYVDFALSERMFPAIHRVIGDLAQVDERLYTARVRPAEAAILLSKANDVWDTEDMLSNPNQERANRLYWANYNVDNNERKGIWMALRHAQFPVDLIADDDVIEGRLSRYKVLYMVGPEIQAAAAPAIASWVRRGGVLFASGGAGLLGEYRQRLDAMYSLYGISGAELTRERRHVEPRKLLTVQPVGTVEFRKHPGWPAFVMPAIAYRQTFKTGAQQKSAGGVDTRSALQVLAHFEDGSIAALTRRVGKGHVVVVGAMPGLAYLRPAMGDRGALPVHYAREVREMLTVPLRLAGCSRHVQTSEPLVEATLMEAGNGSWALVPLINFSPEPVAKLRVYLPGVPNPTSCRSVRRGKLVVHGSGRNSYVELPLDEADLLVTE